MALGPHDTSPFKPLEQKLPNHVAIIMDGNGRWATEKGLPRTAGHQAGTENIARVLNALQSQSVKYVTLYAFSTENWGRPDSEISGLMVILQTAIDAQVKELHKRNVRIRHLGALHRLSPKLRQSITAAVDRTQGNTGLTLCVAFDYGGRAEIVQAVKRIIEQTSDPGEITEELIQSNLYLPDVPYPDLIIRTAGEQRLSNFLIWQAAYSEYYQTPIFWPAFDEKEVQRALDEYLLRQRKFGATSDALSEDHEYI